METPEKKAAEIVAVGENVQSQCGACKSLTSHIIIAMEGEKPAQVRCTICERSHKYRPAPKPRVTKAKKNPDLEEWTKLSPTWADKKQIPYSTSKAFKVNDIVNHAKFGLGQVRQLLEPQKMMVLFEAGVKLMVRGK